MLIARDKEGSLCVFTDKPHKSKMIDNTLWLPSCRGGTDFFSIDSSLFPEVKWEDEEPTEVELVIKK